MASWHEAWPPTREMFELPWLYAVSEPATDAAVSGYISHLVELRSTFLIEDRMNEAFVVDTWLTYWQSIRNSRDSWFGLVRRRREVADALYCRTIGGVTTPLPYSVYKR